MIKVAVIALLYTIKKIVFIHCFYVSGIDIKYLEYKLFNFTPTYIYFNNIAIISGIYKFLKSFF